MHIERTSADPVTYGPSSRSEAGAGRRATTYDEVSPVPPLLPFDRRRDGFFPEAGSVSAAIGSAAGAAMDPVAIGASSGGLSTTGGAAGGAGAGGGGDGGEGGGMETGGGGGGVDGADGAGAAGGTEA